MEGYSTIGDRIMDYTKILTNTIISDYLKENEEVKINFAREYLEDENSNLLSKIIVEDYIMFKQYSCDLGKSEGIMERLKVIINHDNKYHFAAMAASEEKIALKMLETSHNEVLDKGRANELLEKIKNTYLKNLEQEIKKYDLEILLYLFYSLATRLSVLSLLTFHNINTNDTNDLPLNQEDPYSILTTVISNMDTNNIIQTSKHIGREKQLIDIIFNLIYKVYINSQQENQRPNQTDIDIREIYKLASMVMKSNLFLKSNELLYEQGESLLIKDWNLVQSGSFEHYMQSTFSDVVEFNYNMDIVDKVFKQYSKREGFCPQDLTDFINFSFQSHHKGTDIHLKNIKKKGLKEGILEVTNIKDYGIDRFLDILTLKESNDIAHKVHKISLQPFVELKNDMILYSDYMLLQARQTLPTRMLQQSFTSNKKLKKFISTNYDEAGIKDLAKSLEKKGLAYLEHVCIDKIQNHDIKTLLETKGITKEFDLIFKKNKVLYIVEYKTWKIQFQNISQVLNELKKIQLNIDSHLKAINIINEYSNEFKDFFGKEFAEYNRIELIMVFQNPTSFKYLNKSNEVNVLSPNEFNDFI